ncbi:helix-turn-helix domain-containing protein [Alistipes onderdonkii]|uniref:helix-turn-helix domain-containing protein n=1 Tax=Alistipes onderdonkii TaxID=328813 RepID=UPI0034A07AE7
MKCCSDHKTNISHVTEEKLSLLTGLDERTIRRVIKRLKDAGYLTVQTTIKENANRGFIKRNTYYIKPASNDYFFLDNCFFNKNYPAKIAGFILLLKAICLNNTDTVQ